MKKIFAVLFACSMVLAGCTDLTDEDIESIVDAIVEVPGCNGDETAYNYNPNATNNNACLTEMVLKNSVTEFIHLIDDGPEWGETAGMVMEGSETDESGATTSFSTTMAMSPDGMLMLVEMDMGMVVIEIGELMTENPDGTTNIQTTWMGNTFQMNSAALFDTAWNEQNYLEDDDDDHDDDHGDGMDDDHDDDDHGDGMDDDHGDDDHDDGMDDDHGDDDHGDGMDDDHDDDDHDDGMDDDHGDDDHGDDDHDGHDDDMSGDFDLGLPNTEVSIPEDFDPQTALWNAGLGTENGFSFSTVMEHSADHSTTMTFTLSLDFVVTKMIMVDSYYGVDSTSSITILDAEETETLLTNDDTLMEFALPFNMEPISSDDDDHEGHDHGDDDDDHDGHDHGSDDDDQSDDGMGTDEGDGSGSGDESGNDGGMDNGDGTHDDHDDDDDHDGHDHDDHDDHDHHGATYDWGIITPDMMSPAIVEGSFADYYIVLSNCSMDDESDEDGGMDGSDMMETPTMTCGDDVMKVSVSDAATPSPGDDITFHDADNSGTISMGDMVHINPEIVVDGEWNMVRLYSNSTDAYSDENPMLTPGFGAVVGIVALFGAALLTRRD